MLRSLTDEVRVYLSPERVVLIRQTGFIKKRIVDQRVIQVEIPSWQSATHALAQALRNNQWKNARANLILSGGLAQFRLVSWDSRLSDDERLALLRHQFAEVYGEIANGWQITLGDNGYRKPALACAVDKQLIEAVRAVFEDASIRLATVSPYLMMAFNRWRSAIGRDGWFLIVEPAGVTLTLLQNGMWRSVRFQRLHEGWEQEVELMLAREASQQGIHAEAFSINFFWAMRPEFKPVLPGRYKVSVLRLPDTQHLLQTDKALALVLPV